MSLPSLTSLLPIPPSPVPPFSHGSYLASRTLGIPPSSYAYFCTSPFSAALHSTLIPASLGIPTIDFHLSSLTSHLRRLTFFASTFTFNCSYCLAHACVTGDVINGPVPLQVARGGSFPLLVADENDDRLSDVERALVTLANAVAYRKMPNVNVKEQVKNVKAVLGQSATEKAIWIICIAGFLNTCMDAVGARIEGPIAEFAKQVYEMEELQVNDGIHSSLDMQNEREWEIVGVMKMIACVIGVKKLQWQIEKGMPDDKMTIQKWMEEKIGYMPRFVENMKEMQSMKMITSSMRWAMVQEGDEWGRKWNKRNRCALMWVYGKESYCEEMCEIAKGLGRDVVEEADMIYLWKGEGDWSDVMLLAKDVVTASLSGSQRIVGELAENMVKEIQQDAVMELITLMGWWCYCKRALLMFQDEG